VVLKAGGEAKWAELKHSPLWLRSFRAGTQIGEWHHR
jgi:hypothetical protein